MLHILMWALAAVCTVSAVTYAVAAAAAVRHTRQPAPRLASAFPPVSLVKPLKGTEESLAGNLQSFFEQQYPAPFEIIFAAADPADPGVQVARDLAARYSQIPVRFVHPDPDFGLNPKVANVVGALQVARHDLIFQTDANVRIAPDHLAHVVSEYVTQGASLLSSMVVGTGEKSVGAALENLHLTTVIAPAVCFTSDLARRACVVGKALLYCNAELQSLGGMEQFKDVLAEDYLMGERYESARKPVLLSSATVQNVNQQLSVSAFLARHTRWLKMNAVIHARSFLLRFLISPVWVLPLLLVGYRSLAAVLVGGSTLAVFGVTQQFVFRALRRQPMPRRFLLLAPLDALLMWAAWPYAALSRRVNWRGKRLRLGPRSALLPEP